MAWGMGRVVQSWLCSVVWWRQMTMIGGVWLRDKECEVTREKIKLARQFTKYL